MPPQGPISQRQEILDRLYRLDDLPPTPANRRWAHGLHVQARTELVREQRHFHIEQRARRVRDAA